jgi:predicted dehydrogenase
VSVRVGVVGCGAIAYEHLAFLGRSPLVNLVGVCDTSPAAARYAQHTYGAAEAFGDLTEMLARAQLDVLHVLTPPHTHEALSTQAIDAECHVLCEKPAFPTAAVLDRMLEAAAEAGRRLMESHNLLWNDEVVDTHASVSAGALGDVREVDISLSLDLAGGRFGDLNLSGPGVQLPGGAVHDFLPHLSYLFLQFAPGPVTDVMGRLRNLSGNGRVGFDHLDALVNAGQVRGRLKVASDLQPAAFRLVVRGTKASIETDLYNPYSRREGGANIGKRVSVEHITSGLRLAWSGLTNLSDKVMQHGAYHGLPRMLESFYRSLIDGSPQPVSPSAMRAAAALTDQLVALGYAP